VEWSSSTCRQTLFFNKDCKYPDFQKCIAKKIADWYNVTVFLLETTKAAVAVD
jgi:hypothetical protein